MALFIIVSAYVGDTHMSQEQCGHPQGNDTHCDCGKPWKEISAEFLREGIRLRSEQVKLLDSYYAVHTAVRLLENQVDTILRQVVRVRRALRSTKRSVNTVITPYIGLGE